MATQNNPALDIRDFKIPERQRRWEQQRTIALVKENKSCTLECSVLTACSSNDNKNAIGLTITISTLTVTIRITTKTLTSYDNDVRLRQR